MANKFGKFLAITTLVGAAAVGAYYYFQNKDKDPFEDLDDFDDGEGTSEFFTDKENSDRGYVPLDLGKNAGDVVNTAKELAGNAVSAAKNIAGSAVGITKDALKKVSDTTKDNSSVSDVFKDIAKQAEDLGDSAVDTAKDAAKAASDKAEDLVDNTKELVKNTTEKAADSITDFKFEE